MPRPNQIRNPTKGKKKAIRKIKVIRRRRKMILLS